MQVTYPVANFVSTSAIQSNSTAAHTTTLGPFTTSIVTTQFGGLWLVYLEVVFGIPSAAINEDIFLQDINLATVFQWHLNMGIAPALGARILLEVPGQGIVTGGRSGQQQSWNLVTPATVNGPGYSVNMAGYIV